MVRYEVEGRNGYHAIDQYINDRCIRTVITGISRKKAELIASELNYAYSMGREHIRKEQS